MIHHLYIFPREDSPTLLQVLGPQFLGVIVNYLLWGVQIVQSYYYYKTFRNKDKTGLKVAVALLFISDAAQSVASAHETWVSMISNYGDLQGALGHPLWSIYMMATLDAFTASIVHVVYAHKIWTLLKHPYKYIFTVFVLLFSTTQLVAGLGATLNGFLGQGGLGGFATRYKWDSTWLIAASVTDILILTIMAWKLSTSRTGYKKTDDVITKLILLIVETNFATAVVQIVAAALFLALPTVPLHTFPTFIAPKVYSNSMLVLLNSRQQRASELHGMNSVQKSTEPTATALVTLDSTELRSRGLEHKGSHILSNQTSYLESKA